MGIEYRYDYTYYTVIDTERWRRGNEEWLGYDEDDDGFTWEKAIDFINHKFKNSEDKSVNNYRVDYAGYEQDIDAWIRAHERHKERPVFVQFQDDQPITRTGEGSLFVIYQDDGVHYSGAEDEEGYYNPPTEIENNYGSSDCPDGPYYGSLDGLAGAGGRL